MDSNVRQSKIKELVELIQAKQQEIERARERSAMFEERKTLLRELKNLNSQLSRILDEDNYSSN